MVAPFVDEDGDQVTPQRAVRLRHAGHRGRQPDQRFRHARRAGARDLRSRRRPRPSASIAGWSTRASARMRRPSRCGPSSCRSRSSAPARPASSSPAELHNTTRTLVSYGLDRIDPEKDIQLILIEAADRDPAGAAGAPVGCGDASCSRSSASTCARRRAWPRCCPTACGSPTGEIIPAELVVWAAGVKAPDFLKDLDGLETNRINQLVVRPTLQTTRDDEHLRASATAPPARGSARKARSVPPRAQAAHQQASHMVKQIERRLRRQAADAVALSRLRLAGLARRVLSTVGNLMGGLDRRQPVDRRLVRAHDVPVALQDARARAARLLEGGARYRWRE